MRLTNRGDGGGTMFKDQLNAYMEQLKCSGRELAEASGLSAATVSRYRSGERKPESDLERAKLIRGIALLAAARGVSSLTEDAVAEGLGRFFAEDSFDMEHLRRNLNSLFSTLSISNSDLARSTNYDASYLSRIRSGECAAAPARMEQSNPCAWCDWHKICLFDDRLDGGRARRMKSLQPDEAMLKIKSESDGESREKL